MVDDKHIDIFDPLSPMSDEEFAKLPIITVEKIEEALKRADEIRCEVEKYRPALVLSGMRYR